ncbi:hypothetical protein KY306_02270 [Candidatus Woesearchaeota archaeon]|nr:hypothetical protein [Candidatus Woesearchaeota archaeon]
MKKDKKQRRKVRQAKKQKRNSDPIEELKRKDKQKHKEQFPNLDPGMIDWLVDYNEEKYPNHRLLGGFDGAQELLSGNRVTDSRSIDSVLKVGMNYRDFQQLSLYHQTGFFENHNKFNQEGMLLLPQILSPMGGRVFGELMFACAAKVMYYLPKNTDMTFLGLGAGPGYLDFDLINHLQSKMFGMPEYQNVVDAFKNAKYIVSDLTAKSLEHLTKELAELKARSGLRERISLQQIDALDFDLGRLPFGAVYFNELIDNMPTEPILKIGGELYCVKLVPYCLNGRGEDSSDVEAVGVVLGLKGVISENRFRERVKHRDVSDIRFAPVFIPLSYDREIMEAVNDSPCTKKIDSKDFSGVYPIHMGLGQLFRSVRKSFDHGVLMSVDYRSTGQGMHNWNKAVNIFKYMEFGKEDMDFQLDSEQVVAKALQYDLFPEQMEGIGTNFGDILDCFKEWTMFLQREDLERWSRLNPGVGGSGFLKQKGGGLLEMMGSAMGVPDMGIKAAYMMNYGFMIDFAKNYDSLLFVF